MPSYNRAPARALPDSAAVAHSRRLVEHIRASIDAAGGWLPFDRYMEAALYTPGLGYYVAGAPKFGAAGDFVTAPELGPVFGRTLARQVAEALERLGGGDLFEFGAGSGALAAVLLPELARLGRLPEHYRILEPAAELRRRQRERLGALPADLGARVDWVEGLPERLHGIVLANEVLDAMPVHRFLIQEGIREIQVGWDGDGFVERAGRVSSPGLSRAVAGLQAEGLARDPGYASEVNLRLGPWIAALAESLEAGLLLILDYGYPRREYYLRERRQGTLICHYRHHAHADPYFLPGLQDITANVDFSALAQAGREAGLELLGYTTQAHFLLGCGLDEVVAGLNGNERLDGIQQAKQLVLPQIMGERFQVMALGRGIEGPLRGFRLRDLRDRL